MSDAERTFFKESVPTTVRVRNKTITFEGAAAAATLSTNLTGTNNDLVFTAPSGVAGNSTSIEYRAPTSASQALSVEVSGQDIVVNLAAGAGTNEVQTVTVVAAGGSFILGYKDQFTQKIPYDATTAVVQAKLRELPGLSDVVVGGVAGAWTVTFSGSNAGTDVALLQIDGNRLTPHNPGVLTKTLTAGSASPATNEVQQVALVNAAAGTFTLTFSGQTTSALAYNISAANLKLALEALSNIGVDEALVTGSAGLFQIEFDGTLGDSNQPLITGNAAGLRVASVAATTPGVAYAIASTAAEVDAAIDALPAAAALVTPSNKAANDGSGVVTAMAKTYLTGGKAGVGALNGKTRLFKAVGDLRVAIVLHGKVLPVGATGTIKIGNYDASDTAVDDDSLVPSIVGTTITADRTVDKSGLVTVGSAPVTTPHQLLQDGEFVEMLIGTAALTAGALEATAYYTPVEDSAYLVAV